MRCRGILSAAFSGLSAVSFFTCCGGGSTGPGPVNPGQPTVEYYYGAGAVNINAYKVDLGSGKLSKFQTVSTGSTTTTLVNSFAATSPAKFLYVMTPDTDGVDAYSLGSDGSLTLVAGSPFKPQGYESPAYALGSPVISAAGDKLFVLDAFNSQMLSYKIDPNSGALTFAANTMIGFNPGGLSIDPSGKFLYIPTDIADYLQDYGGVQVFQVDAAGKMTQTADSPFQLPVNSEPSGVVMDPTGTFLYVSLFNQGQIVAFKRDAASGDLTGISGSPYSTSSNSFPETSSLSMHPSGKFLYAYDLNGNTISGFSIDSNTGALSELQGSPFKGQTNTADNSPLSQGPIYIDPSGKFMYSLCNHADIAVFTINTTTGAVAVASGSPLAQTENIVGQFSVQAP